MTTPCPVTKKLSMKEELGRKISQFNMRHVIYSFKENETGRIRKMETKTKTSIQKRQLGIKASDMSKSGHNGIRIGELEPRSCSSYKTGVVRWGMKLGSPKETLLKL